MRKWVIKEQNPTLSKEISSKTGLSLVTSQLLINRKLTTKGQIDSFFCSDLSKILPPDSMKDIEKAARRIKDAILNGEKITVHGDYDVDGITATSIFYNFFKEIDYPLDYYMPSRLEEGYGLSLSAIEECKKNRVKLLITVDCGISAVSEVEEAKKCGIDVIITDHHEAPEILPAAYAVVNPKRKDCKFPYKELSGAGVAFYVLAALRKELKDVGFFEGKNYPNLKCYLDLVALGTIADVSPATDLNRTFIRYGLHEIEQNTRCGLSALMDVSGVLGREVKYRTVAFMLAPRLNACGRLGTAHKAVELLTQNDTTKLKEIACALDENNKERQKIEDEILNEIFAQAQQNDNFKDKKIIILGAKHWHEGVIGIVASRIAEKYFRPVILVSFGNSIGKGSGRSIPGFNLYKSLESAKEFLERFGGHEYAIGLQIKEENFENFKKKLEEYAQNTLKEENLIPTLYLDAKIEFKDINLQLINEIKFFEPYGPKNPEPLLFSSGLSIKEKRVLKEKHLKMKLTNGGISFDSIGFNLASMAGDIKNKVDIAYIPEINSYQGVETIQLKLKDIRNSE